MHMKKYVLNDNANVLTILLLCISTNCQISISIRGIFSKTVFNSVYIDKNDLL